MVVAVAAVVVVVYLGVFLLLLLQQPLLSLPLPQQLLRLSLQPLMHGGVQSALLLLALSVCIVRACVSECSAGGGMILMRALA